MLSANVNEFLALFLLLSCELNLIWKREKHFLRRFFSCSFNAGVGVTINHVVICEIFDRMCNKT